MNPIAAAWNLTLAAAAAAKGSFQFDQPARYALTQGEVLARVAGGDSAASIEWIPDRGWSALLAGDDSCRDFLDLYLPVASGHAGRPVAVGHLGQSLDGFIATHTGDSCYVTGEENVRHLHRMRALCDAVIVGAGTIAADDPQLTTRHVPGPNPVRVVLDPSLRLDDQYRVFNDGQSPALLICAEGARDRWSRTAQVEKIEVAGTAGKLDLAAVIARLQERGLTRLFIEGGGVTVSGFLEARLLDRLQIAVAPLLIGTGRPAIRLPAPLTLNECRRLTPRVFSMGNDVLFDCALAQADEPAALPASTEIRRVL